MGKNKNGGLTTKEAEKRLVEYGYNELAAKKKISACKIFVSQFKDILIIILLVSTILSVLMGEIVEAIAIIVIVFVNSLLGFFQEYKTEKTLDALKKMAAPLSKVMRDGKISEIPARELVVDDIILIETGDKIPADAKILNSSALMVDESILTGESVAVEKSENSDDSNIYMGTVATKGRCRAIITKTGMNTEMGKIAHMLNDIEDEQTPLQKRLSELGKYIAVGCLVICLIVTLTGIMRGEPIFDMVVTGISLAVAAVPEGLPTIVTISLALAVSRMLKRNALVRKLDAVETLGSASVICSDKTGTLTENKMSVTKISTYKENFNVSGTGYSKYGDILKDGEKINLKSRADVEKLL
ncbi:MAG: HAD-IC family P-type ATPase, partial [Oscillospiraceae bacterium]|nr:HAD-IC family P-type ATPase [Oscillospiraceae bacterium]